MKKGKGVDIVINFSQLKKEDETFYSLGEKFIKGIVKELKPFLGQRIGKYVKIKTADIGKDIGEIDMSQAKGLIVDPLTLSKIKVSSILKPDIGVFIFDPFHTGIYDDPSLKVYGIFDTTEINRVDEKKLLLNRLLFFIVSILKGTGGYLEEDLTYNIKSYKVNPYLLNESGVLFLNDLKDAFFSMKKLEKNLKMAQEEYKLYRYKLREKMVIKDKKRMQEEILKEYREFNSKFLGKIPLSFSSVLFAYDSPVKRDIFKRWFLEDFVLKVFKDIRVQSFSVYSHEEGRDFFGFVPNNLAGEDILFGVLPENQGNVVVLEEIPSSPEFFEKLLHYVNTGKVVSYGRRVEFYAPAILILFIDIERFRKFKNYLSFSYMFKIPDPFVQEDILNLFSIILTNFMGTTYQGKEIKITYDALSFLKNIIIEYENIGDVVFLLRDVLSKLGSSSIITKGLLQDTVRRLS